MAGATKIPMVLKTKTILLRVVQIAQGMDHFCDSERCPEYTHHVSGEMQTSVLKLGDGGNSDFYPYGYKPQANRQVTIVSDVRICGEVSRVHAPLLARLLTDVAQG